MERHSGNMAYLEAERDEPVVNPVISIAPPKRTAYLMVKRAFDVVLSALALVVLSPVFLIVAAAIKLEDGEPVIHVRNCVGQNDTSYKMYKFRTMVVDADNYQRYLSPKQQMQLYQEQKVRDDPRITKVGYFLRKTSLDELPQLFSILKGDMSIVGPRPVIEAECRHYGSNLPVLLSVQPGLTGLWQVSGRSECTYESGERQKLELHYARNASLMMDFEILLKTVKVVLRGIGAR